MEGSSPHISLIHKLLGSISMGRIGGPLVRDRYRFSMLIQLCPNSNRPLLLFPHPIQLIQSSILFNKSGSKVDGIATNDGVRNEAVLYSSLKLGDVPSSSDVDLYHGGESFLAQHECIKLVYDSKNQGKSGIFVDEQYDHGHPSGDVVMKAGGALKENELW